MVRTASAVGLSALTAFVACGEGVMSLMRGHMDPSNAKHKREGESARDAPRLCAFRPPSDLTPQPWQPWCNPEFGQPPRRGPDDLWLQLSGGWVIRTHRVLCGGDDLRHQRRDQLRWLVSYAQPSRDVRGYLQGRWRALELWQGLRSGDQDLNSHHGGQRRINLSGDRSQIHRHGDLLRVLHPRECRVLWHLRRPSIREEHLQERSLTDRRATLEAFHLEVQ
eukprot:s278_g34.t1